MDIKKIKKEFPIFSNYKELVYLDNAATTQKPKQVINALVDFYSKYNSNVHRGLYPLSETATKLYEEARTKVAKFINAEPEEIIFTSGTTDSINSIVESLRLSNLFHSDSEVLLTEVEHHSNLIPFQRVSKNITFAKINKNFEIEIPENINPDIIAITLISNVTGKISDIKFLRTKFPNALIILDAAQAAAHIKIDVKDLGIDFLAFSGHKMYAPTGIGVLYGRMKLLEKLEPFRVGGGMINSVTKKQSTWAEIPEKFEAGTPNIAGAYALGIGVDFINSIGFTKIQEHEKELRSYLIEKLTDLKDIEIYHDLESNNSIGVVSFNIKEIHPHDVAQYLGDNEICVRAGHHCAQILHREVLQIAASVRISLVVYNTKEDIDRLIEKLLKVAEIYKH